MHGYHNLEGFVECISDQNRAHCLAHNLSRRNTWIYHSRKYTMYTWRDNSKRIWVITIYWPINKDPTADDWQIITTGHNSSSVLLVSLYICIRWTRKLITARIYFRNAKSVHHSSSNRLRIMGLIDWKEPVISADCVHAFLAWRQVYALPSVQAANFIPIVTSINSRIQYYEQTLYVNMAISGKRNELVTGTNFNTRLPLARRLTSLVLYWWVIERLACSCNSIPLVVGHSSNHCNSTSQAESHN